jgi:hypothetical protein
MNRKIIVLIIVTLGISIIAGTFWVSQQHDELDTSWIDTVTQFLEEAKPYPNPDGGYYLLSRVQIYLYENGTDQLVLFTGESDFTVYLENLMRRASRQKNAPVSKAFIDEVLNTDKVLSFDLRFYHNFHVWENFESALFVLEDNLDQGLEGTIYVKQNIGGQHQWSSWSIMK